MKLKDDFVELKELIMSGKIVYIQITSITPTLKLWGLLFKIQESPEQRTIGRLTAALIFLAAL